MQLKGDYRNHLFRSSQYLSAHPQKHKGTPPVGMEHDFAVEFLSCSEKGVSSSSCSLAVPGV